MEEALERASAAVEETHSASQLANLRAALMKGESFDQAVADCGLFGGLHGRLLRLGAAAGREDEVLGKIAADCEEKVDERVSRLISVVEPALVALLSVVVGAILLSVMLPMAGILSNLM